MSGQHTPGPHWVEGSIYEGYAACVVGRVSVEGHADRETRALAQVRTFPDAILYASAPAMKAALEAELADLNEDIRWAEGSDMVRFIARRERMEAALALARGERS